jgi:hypothetical protein
VVRDLREARSPAGPDELAAFETGVLAGFALARAAAGLADGTTGPMRRTWSRRGRGSAARCGIWAGSGSCMCVRARVPAGPGPASGWCR